MTMKNTNKIALILIMLGFSFSVIAQTPKTPNPPVPIIPTLAANPTGTAATLISGVQSTGSSSFVFIYMDPKKVYTFQVNSELAFLNAQLNPYGIAPCLVSADVNATGIKCGKDSVTGTSLISFSTNEFYSFVRPYNLAKLPITYDTGVKQVFGANFKSPVGLLPGDAFGKNVHLHFDRPVSQFMIHIDAGNPLAPSVSGIQFYVSNGTTAVASTPVKTLTAPTQFVGVQRAAGFTDLVIVPTGGQSQAFAADLFSVVPTANYIP